MYIIFDNLNAMIIGGVVILVVLAMQMQVAEVNIEQTANYMVKRQGVDLATWMEDDLLSLGLHIDKADEVPFENPDYEDGLTKQFVFYQDSIDTSVNPTDTIRIATRYTLEAAGSTTIKGDSVKIYQLERDQRLRNGSTWSPWFTAGHSPAILSHFRIDMLNRDAQPVSSPEDVAEVNPDSIRNTRVRFALVTPFETRQATLTRIYYGSTLMIPN